MRRNTPGGQEPYDPYGQPYGQQQPYAHDPYAQDPYGQEPYGQEPPRRPRVSAGRLWAGGVAVALVAALASVVVLLLVRGVLGWPVFAPERDGALVAATGGSLAAGAALAALAATALLHLLMVATPQPERFLAWIVALATAAVMLQPFTSDASWEAKAGSAVVYLVIGIVIGSLLTAVGRGARNDG
ncbi:hypothetical protein GCM10009801_54820 [Streptomyces albiaxialis]|uniref:Integral membrane protein n=1 Tax=Streptomyces albiaxialis TaxID=329523 RepID=A0ABP5I270_9ACTN